MQPKSTLSRLALAAAAGMLLMASASPATAETFVTNLPLEEVGVQRVLYAAPANPRAPLVSEGEGEPRRWCYDKPAAERHWDRLVALYGRRLG